MWNAFRKQFSLKALILTAAFQSVFFAMSLTADLANPNSDHDLHFQSSSFVQISSAYTHKSQKIGDIQTNAVHIPNGSSATPPNFYNKGSSSFRKSSLQVRAIALYEFSETTNCYAAAAQGLDDQFDFGRDFGASDYGYAYEDKHLSLKGSCAYKVNTPGGNIGAFGGLEWIKSASTFQQKQNISPPSATAVWTTNEITAADTGSSFRYSGGLSYYNGYFDARATLSGATSAVAKVTGTYNQSIGGSSSFSGTRMLKPAEIRLGIEKRLKPTWSIKGEIGMAFGSKAAEDSRGFTTSNTFLDTSSQKNQLSLGLTSINQLKPKLNLRTSLYYQQGRTGGNVTGLAISEGATVAAKAKLRYDVKDNIFIDAGLGISRTAGGTSTYLPDASVRRLIIKYDAETQVEAGLGLGYRF